MNQFAFTNDAGLPRLIRYVEHGTLPNVNLISLYSEASNLLVIDRDHYERIDDTSRHILLRTQKKSVEIYYYANKNPTITV